MGGVMRWREQALCRGEPVELFVPKRGGVTLLSHKAKEICGRCPVASECLVDALADSEHHIGGTIRAATTDRPRRALRQGVCPSCHHEDADRARLVEHFLDCQRGTQLEVCVNPGCPRALWAPMAFPPGSRGSCRSCRKPRQIVIVEAVKRA